MPLYEFECKNCGKNFEDIVTLSKCDTCPDTKCEYCESKNWVKLMPSSFAWAFSNPEGTDRWNSGSSGHDYRFKHNIPKVKAERAAAESMSHMGARPYGNDEIKADIERDIGIHDAETRKGLS